MYTIDPIYLALRMQDEKEEDGIVTEWSVFSRFL